MSFLKWEKKSSNKLELAQGWDNEPPRYIKPSLAWWNGGAWSLASDLLPVAGHVLVWKASITAGLNTIPSRRVWAQWEWTVALLLTKAGMSSGLTLILVAASFHCCGGSPAPGGHTREASLAHPQACPPPQVLFLTGNCVNCLFWWFPLVGNNCT